MSPLITLTTDFGEDSPYVAAMKGVVLGINPSAQLIDLSHQIPPQDLRHAAYFLETALPYFPRGGVHVVVVDPGVGSERALLLVEVAGHRLLVPDNGCWTGLADRFAAPPKVFRLSEPRYWLPTVSATFHGRDILAPVAAHLSLGVTPEAVGTPVTEWVRRDKPAFQTTADGVVGEVIFVDRFGNLITNIPAEALPDKKGICIRVGGREISRRVRTYAEALPGAPVALVSSSGTLEIAVPLGSAATHLGAGIGSRVTVHKTV